MTQTAPKCESYKLAVPPIFKTLYKEWTLHPIGQTALRMLPAAECRSNSVECERLAREALSSPIRMAWADMARTWTVLADKTATIGLT